MDVCPLLGELVKFEPEQALSLRDAAALIRGRGGRPGNLCVLRRFANPKVGCRPAGASGPCIILPTTYYAGCRMLMKQWATAFEEARRRIGSGATLPQHRQPTARQQSAAHQRAVEELQRRGVRM